MRKQSWEIGGMYASHPKVIMHEVKNNNIDYLTFEILEDGIVTFTPSQETNILSWSFNNGSTWIEGNEIQVKKGDVVRCKGECVPDSAAQYGIGQFQTTCYYNLSGKTSSLLPVPVELTEEEVIDTIYAATCGIYTMNIGSSGESALQSTYPTFSKKDKVIAFFLDQGQQLSWEQIVQQMQPVLMDTQEHLLQRNYNLVIQMEEVSQRIPNYAELTPEEFFITFAKLNIPYATELDGIGVGLVIGMELSGASIGYEYFRLFDENSKLIDASKLTVDKFNEFGCVLMFHNCSSLKCPPLLPDPVKNNCYNGMFEGCTNLIKAPELSAITLAQDCYSYMFSRCSSLVTAPELPATTLANNCYSGMFVNCISLTTAPELPATTLTDGCYENMFSGCTSLITVLALPATTLVYSCYNYMFSGCTNLNNITMLATDISAISCLYNWVSNVSSTGTFIKHPDAEIPTGTSGIPEGWVVETVDI